MQKKTDLKNEINNLQAQISLMRISLKAKVKKKSLTFRSQFPKPPVSGDLADQALNELIENKFETGKDMQDYFDLSRQINVIITSLIDGYTPTENFMCSDFKNELSIINLIRNISTYSTRLNKRIEAFNLKNPDAQMPNIDHFIFVSMIDVNRILNEHNVAPEDLEITKPAA